MPIEQFETLSKLVWREAFVGDKLVCGSGFQPAPRDYGDQGKDVGLALFSRLRPEAVIACGFVCVRRVHQVMGKLMKHHEELFPLAEFAVDSDEVPAHYAIVKPAHRQRYFFAGDLKLAAESVKISLGERPLVPTDL